MGGLLSGGAERSNGAPASARVRAVCSFSPTTPPAGEGQQGRERGREAVGRPGREAAGACRPQTGPVRERDPVLTGLLLGLYVVPLVAAVGLLLLASLPRLAVALVVVELAVSAAIAVARPGTTPRKQDPDAGSHDSVE